MKKSLLPVVVALAAMPCFVHAQSVTPLPVNPVVLPTPAPPQVATIAAPAPEEKPKPLRAGTKKAKAKAVAKAKPAKKRR